jgi:hypothetical protein
VGNGTGVDVTVSVGRNGIGVGVSFEGMGVTLLVNTGTGSVTKVTVLVFVGNLVGVNVVCVSTGGNELVFGVQEYNVIIRMIQQIQRTIFLIFYSPYF